MNEKHEILRAALQQWDDAQNDSASMETGLEALGLIITHAAHDAKRYALIINAAAALVPLYLEFDTDPDGEASQRLYEAMAETGWPD